MRVLCLHTLRADCNAPLTPLRVALPCFASTRSVQIATFPFSPAVRCWFLCLHTLRADCNLEGFLFVLDGFILCLHTLRADCNHHRRGGHARIRGFASTRSVQIATFAERLPVSLVPLCLHTLRADCNLPRGTSCITASSFASTRSVQIATTHDGQYQYVADLCLHTLRADCNGRNAQNCNIHFFRTCVELVDSFSVLNKSMLR